MLRLNVILMCLYLEIASTCRQFTLNYPRFLRYRIFIMFTGNFNNFNKISETASRQICKNFTILFSLCKNRTCGSFLPSKIIHKSTVLEIRGLCVTSYIKNVNVTHVTLSCRELIRNSLYTVDCKYTEL